MANKTTDRAANMGRKKSDRPPAKSLKVFATVHDRLRILCGFAKEDMVFTASRLLGEAVEREIEQFVRREQGEKGPGSPGPG